MATWEGENKLKPGVATKPEDIAERDPGGALNENYETMQKLVKATDLHSALRKAEASLSLMEMDLQNEYKENQVKAKTMALALRWKMNMEKQKKSETGGGCSLY